MFFFFFNKKTYRLYPINEWKVYEECGLVFGFIWNASIFILSNNRCGRTHIIYNRISIGTSKNVRVLSMSPMVKRIRHVVDDNNDVPCDYCIMYILGKRHTERWYVLSGTRVILITRLHHHNAYNARIQIVYLYL